MKEFKKIKELFVCEECHKTFKQKNSLSKHISTIHNSQEYYDKWLKNKDEDKCKICNNKNIFISIGKGYKCCCSREHLVKWNHIQIQNAIFKKYGVKSSLSLNKFREGGMIKKYGVKNPYQSEIIKMKIKNTWNQKYGVDNPFKSEKIKNKIKQTNKKKYGVEYPTQSAEIRNKIKESFKKSFEVEYALQNLELFIKQQKSAYYARKYMNSKIYYRGSFEFDFLNNYYNKINIQNANSIKYNFKGKTKIYFPDFYIPSLNLIVEIKNSYLVKKDIEKIEAKKKATIANGFNYIMIVNKDYSKFHSYL